MLTDLAVSVYSWFRLVWLHFCFLWTSPVLLSKYAESNLHPIRISSETLARYGPRLDLHNMVLAVCGRTQLSVKVGNWYGADCILPEAGLMIHAYWLASRPDAFGQILTRPSRSDLGQFCNI